MIVCLTWKQQISKAKQQAQTEKHLPKINISLFEADNESSGITPLYLHFLPWTQSGQQEIWSILQGRRQA
jgi:hypothetical protein